MGTEGAREVIVNSLGREIGTPLREDPPREGTRVQLTIDADLQKAAEDGFKHFGEVNRNEGYNGAAIVLDPNSGEVLSLVSLPAFDPNKFAVGLDRATWQSYSTDKLRPLQNRALQGTYSPGSTFKLVVATAALEEGLVTPDYKVNCPGGATFYGRYFQCHLKGGHGVVDMRHAIEKSCNVYFYTLGNMLGVDKIHKWASLLGLGERNNIDLPNEVRGLVPSTEWKRQVMKEKWYAGETISVAIGQGQVNVTPLSLARDDDDPRQRRHPLHATRAQGRGRGQGMDAGDAARAAVHGGDEGLHGPGDPRRAVAGRERRRNGRPRPARRARRLGQDRARRRSSR